MSTTQAPPPIAEREQRHEPVPTVPVDPVRATRPWLGPLLIALAGVSIAEWLLLYRWYGLLDNRDNTHFSFEKIPGGFDSSILRETALIFIVIAAAFAAMIPLLTAIPSMPKLGAVGVIALIAGPAIANIWLYPVGALDVFNYMIELKLAYHFDQNPYLVTFEAYRQDPFALPAFLVNVTLFYGPAWLLASGIPALVTGYDDVIATLLGLKIFNVALIGVTALLIAWYHRDRRLAWLGAALFAANPLVLFEGVANGHNDVLLTVFVVAAMLALERRSPLAGPLLALSALVKLYTVALVPIFIVVALKEHWGWKRISTTVVLTSLAVVVTCTPFWGDGRLVDGLQAGLEESQEMDHVSPLSLARQYEQEQVAQDSPDTEYIRSRPSFEIVPLETQDEIKRGFTIVFVIATLLLAFAVWRGRPPALASAETLLLLYLMMTNLYGWYLIPVIALLALWPDRLSRWYIPIATLLGLIYYPAFVWGHYNSGWTRFHIHLFLALFLTVPILLYLAARVVTWRRSSQTPLDLA
jgi:magnesium-transporting ATPase (P-type)